VSGNHREYDTCVGCGAQATEGALLCNVCAKGGRTPTPPLVAKRPEYIPKNGGCGKCKFVVHCQERVFLNQWVMCEIPDELDIRIVERM